MIISFLRRLILKSLGKYQKVEFEGPVFSSHIIDTILKQHPADLVFIYQTNLVDPENDGVWTYQEHKSFSGTNKKSLLYEIAEFQSEKRFGSWKLDGTRSLDGEEFYESRFWVAVEVYG